MKFSCLVMVCEKGVSLLTAFLIPGGALGGGKQLSERPHRLESKAPGLVCAGLGKRRASQPGGTGLLPGPDFISVGQASSAAAAVGLEPAVDEVTHRGPCQRWFLWVQDRLYLD